MDARTIAARTRLGEITLPGLTEPFQFAPLRLEFVDAASRYNVLVSSACLKASTPNEAYGLRETMRLAALQQPGPSLIRPSNCPTE